MTEIGFYHLLSTPLDRALPKLLERAYAQHYRIVVRAGSPERVAHLDRILWIYDEASFLPHAGAGDGNSAMQPILLTDRDGNPNGASMLVLVDGRSAEDVARFARCADLFDGHDQDAVVAARERWRRARADGHALSYWQQTNAGWERRA